MMKKIIPTIIFVVFTIFVIYFFQPILNIWFTDLWFTVLALIFASAFIFNIKIVKETYGNSFIFDKDKGFVKFTIFVLLFVVFILNYAISTGEFFHYSKYRNLLGEVKESNFTQDISPIDLSKIRIVDEEMARKLGEKKLGEDPGLGSRVEIGDFEIQKVKDKLYWIAPLNHSGYFVWFTHESGTPGYIQVSATNPDDVKMVQSVNGKDIFIKYQPGAYFLQNLTRYIYFSGYMTRGFTDMTFEVDDEGKPYWVVSLYEHSIGFSGSEVNAILIVDAESGEINEYSLDKVPSWVDRVQPAEFIYSQINNWGKYIYSYLNFIVSGNDTLKSSSKNEKGLRLVYGENGKSYWYSGLTSFGKDGSTVGFLLVDSRTKEVFRYNISGATEDAAEDSAEGAAQQFKYKASNFIPYNLDGHVSYIGPLKDNSGLIKGVAIVNMQNYNIVAWGGTILEANSLYKRKLSTSINSFKNNSDDGKKTINGIIERFAFDIKSGESIYYMMISEYDNKIFRIYSNDNIKLPLTKVGDNVKISYFENDSNLIEIENFDNLSIKFNLSNQKWWMNLKPCILYARLFLFYKFYIIYFYFFSSENFFEFCHKGFIKNWKFIFIIIWKFFYIPGSIFYNF